MHILATGAILVFLLFLLTWLGKKMCQHPRRRLKPL